MLQSNTQVSSAVNAALTRVGRLPLPTKVGAEVLCDGRGYSDDPYVDCPYDDYQDYNDSTEEDSTEEP